MINTKYSDTALALFLTGLIIALMWLSPNAKEGAQNGIAMCENIIIPSLLPIMILTNLLQKTSAARVFERLFGGFFVRVLRLPKSAVTPVFFGLIGGYPTGAVLTYEQFKAGLITSETASRIMRFNFSGGLAFIISAVGGSYYKSRATGAVLFCVCLLSELIIAPFGKRQANTNHIAERSSFSDALCNSTEISSKSVILMGAYIILFCALINVFNPPNVLLPLFEITSGIFTSKVKIPLPYCAFFLSFGGLCVHLQVAGILAKMKVKYSEFLLFRVASAVFSYALCEVYCKVFPQSSAVFANSAVSVPFQFSQNVSISIIAMLGCAVLVLDIENRKISI